MGTVPDPLRSARLSLVAAPEEKNGLREPQPSRSQCRQASIETNSNGFPIPAKAQTAGEHLFDVSCAPAEEKHGNEQRCGYDTNQASIFSPGSLSLSSEGHSVILEPASNSELKSSHGAGDLAVVEGCTLVQKMVKMLPTQGANEMQSGDRGQVSRATDKANSTAGDGVKGSEAHGCLSSSLPSAAQQVSPAAKETAGEKTGPERTRLSAKEPEVVSDPGVKSSVVSDAELLARKDSEQTDRKDANPQAEVVSEMARKPSLESTAQPSSKTEAEEKAVAELSKFRDTGTMTVQMESWSTGGEVARRDRQDAEVQAVASVENKSASTSPSISAAFLQESVCSETKPEEEQLHLISAGGGGKGRSEMADSFAPPTGIVPDVHVQATVDTLGTQALRLQSDPVGMHNTVCTALLGSGKHPCSLPSISTQETPADRVEAQKAGVAANRGDSPPPLDASVFSKTRPVYQITVNSSNQPLAPSHSTSVKTELPPSAVLSELDHRPQDPNAPVAENHQASPSCRRLSEQAACTVVSAQDNKKGQPLQILTVSSLETGPGSSHMDVKPKREEKFAPVPPSKQETSKTQAAAGPQTDCSPSPGSKEQPKFPEHNKETKLSGSQNLAAGPESESRRSPNPARGFQVAKGSEIKKGPKLDKTGSPAHHRLHILGNKKEPRPAAEARVQVKQSKRVKDVVWDEQGMTWEVYGASLDPESLGIAIQNHLQRQIREHEKLIKSQSAQNRKSISSDTSSNKKLKGRQHGVFHSVLQNFRRPNCCVRPAASSVLD